MAERLTKTLYILQQTKRKEKTPKMYQETWRRIPRGTGVFGGYNRILSSNLHFEINNINIKH